MMNCSTTEQFKISEFSPLCYLPTGLHHYVDVAQILLELNTIVKEMADGKISGFKPQERSLYEPLRRKFNTHLPSCDLVKIENSLTKTANKQQKTDISLSNISTHGKPAKDLEFTHFVEIKSVFFQERIHNKDILNDLKKLIDCKTAYSAVCFFVLVGFEDDLKKNKKHLQVLGVLGENPSPFEVTTSTNSGIWLRPAGSNQAADPFVYVWEVSTKNDFADQARSGCSFSIFQKQKNQPLN